MIVKLAPLPGAFVTEISPLCCSIIRRVIASPNPVPCCRVVKNGLNILCRFSLEIPFPVSVNTSTTDPDLSLTGLFDFDSTVKVPPCGMA